MMLFLAVFANLSTFLHYLVRGPVEPSFYYMANPFILIVFATMFSRLTSRNAFAVSTLVLATYESAEVFFGGALAGQVSLTSFVAANRMLVTIYGICAWSCILIENGLKREYVDQARLAELDRRKMDFFANVSHELRTPLTLIQGPAQAIRSGMYGPEIRSDDPVFESMVRNGDRLLTLIERILDFTRLDEPSARVSKTGTDISAFMRGIIESVDSAARARGISLSFFDGTDGLKAPIDRDLTEKAVLNLLSNAMKFTPKGGSIVV